MPATRDSIVQAGLIPASELAAGGYLQEVNRLFFHPLGLALSARTDEVHVIGVHDGRDDPEGVVFDVAGNRGELIDDDSRSKAEAVRLVWRERATAREHALGFVVQPVQRVGDPVGDVIEAIDGVEIPGLSFGTAEDVRQRMAEAVLTALGLVGGFS